MPHQLEPALAVVRGRAVRVLLADDVGLGKTIEAGLILAELRERAAAPRALVLTPSGLREQWQAELRGRFAIDAAIADTCALSARSGQYVGEPNPWRTYDVVIASTDLVKRSEHLARVVECPWDIVIVDEAHNAVGDSDRRAAVERIAGGAAYVVLVTATPHNGDPAAFAALCGLGAHGEQCAVFRRTRAEVNAGPLRHARRLDVAPTSAERRMHAALTGFTRAVIAEHAAADADIRLALAVLHKRALSSAYALEQTVARRLRSIAAGGAGSIQDLLPFDDPDGELDVRDEAPSWPAGPLLEDCGRERRMLAGVGDAASAAAAGGESKIDVVRRWLRRVHEPVIVFSEYRDTIRHLAAAIGAPSVQLHGGLTAAGRREVLEAFPSKVPLLLATDAAGEGLNLHERCRLVINLELPWNPVRLEQRIGRVDRIGQTRTVHAITLVASDTAEQQILARLRARVARARHDIGAAPPVGVLSEADVERLVLGLAPEDHAAEQPPDLIVRESSLATLAQREVQRALLARRVRVNAEMTATGGCLVATTRHRTTRELLRERTLLLVELIVQDGRGAAVERILLPLAAEWIGEAATRHPRLLARVVAGNDLVSGCCAEAGEVARAFAGARLDREQRITVADESRIGAYPQQQGLFDRRLERLAAAVRASAQAAAESRLLRTAGAARAADGICVKVRVRVLLWAAR